MNELFLLSLNSSNFHQIHQLLVTEQKLLPSTKGEHLLSKKGSLCTNHTLCPLTALQGGTLLQSLSELFPSSEEGINLNTALLLFVKKWTTISFTYYFTTFL